MALPAGSQCARVLEGRMVNVAVTGAGATTALMLTYLMTDNHAVAARLAPRPVPHPLRPKGGSISWANGQPPLV